MKFLETINDGMTKVANQLEIDRENREYEQLKGLMSDEEKIRLLKYELYSATNARSNPENLEQLRETIAVLRDEVESERKYQNSLFNQLNTGMNTLIGLLALATVASYAVGFSGICNHVNSRFCRNTRIIPYAVERYFYDEPALVNPKNTSQSN
jgi:hypothetical protein